MTTARALLRRFLRHRRLDPQVPRGGQPGGPAAEERLEAARQRLKQTIAPPEEPPDHAATPPGTEGPRPTQT